MRESYLTAAATPSKRRSNCERAVASMNYPREKTDLQSAYQEGDLMMNYRHTPVRLAVAAILGASAFTGLTPKALAQEAAQAAKKEPEILEEVHVTGSRIVRRDMEANSPTLTVGAEILENRTDFSVEGALN